MKVDHERVRKARIEMLPLIDIVFLLLVFFIYAMLSMAVHRALPVTLPKSTAAKVDTDAILSVTVKSDGSVYLDKQPVSIEDLSEQLSRKALASKDPGVLLFADRNLSYQYLFKVLDQIRMAGLTRISLQAEADE
ncbi:MAG: biopolymer transporter ExbD [Deltaproteobacteria bacterium]|nr:biopolymer transporter ExbD [Deltaproteobacteria bacterium]